MEKFPAIVSTRALGFPVAMATLESPRPLSTTGRPEDNRRALLPRALRPARRFRPSLLASRSLFSGFNTAGIEKLPSFFKTGGENRDLVELLLGKFGSPAKAPTLNGE